MSRLRPLLALAASLIVGAFAVSVVAQERTSPPRPPGGSGALPSGSYSRTCRGANMNGNILSAQCPGPSGAPIFSSIDTNGCRGRDIANDGGYLRCNSGGGPRPPEPPRPVPPRPVPPRPIPPVPPRPIPPEPPVGGNFEAIVYTRANFQGQSMRIRGPCRTPPAMPA